MRVRSLVCAFHVTAKSLRGMDLVFWSQLHWILLWGQSLSLGQLSRLYAPRIWSTSERKRQDYAGQIPATKFPTQLSDSQWKREREVE